MSEIETSQAELELLDLRELDRRIDDLLDALELVRLVRRNRLRASERAVLRQFAWSQPWPEVR